MGKKYETSDFDFDKDFGIGDFDFDEPKRGSSKRSRHEEIARSAFKGVGEGLTENLIESTIRRALPKGYGEALDLYNEGKNSLESLYNTAFKELKPGIDSTKRLTRQIMPGISNVLPESIENFLKEWSAPDASDGAGDKVSEETQRDNSMAIEIGAIFQGQAEMSARTEQRADARDRIRESLTQVRHNQEMKALSLIAQNVHRQTQYQDKILINFQRKSLELQMRQYYATVDQLNVTRKGFMIQKQLLEAIAEYSRMPDFEKTTISTKFKELTRNKFIEQARDSMFGRTGEFFKRFTDNITKSVGQQLSMFASGLAMSADSIGMGIDMAKSMGGEFDPATEGAGMAGRAAGDFLLSKLQGTAAGKLAKNKNIARGSHFLQYGTRNMQHVTRKFLNNSGVENAMGERTWGPLDFLRRFLLENVPGMGADLSIDRDKVGDLHQPAAINKLTLKTWNEVIPGYLARIHREIYQLRTGDEKAPLMAYDFSSNRFSTEKGVANSVLKGFLSQGRPQVKNNISEIMQTVGLNNLRGNPRRQVEEAILSHAMTQGDTSFDTMSKTSTWKSLSPNLRKLVANSFKRHYGSSQGEFTNTAEGWAKINSLDSKFKDLTHSLSDPRAHIQSLINAGQLEALVRYGVVTEDGKINLELFKQYLINTKQVDEDGEFINKNLNNPKFHQGSGSGSSATSGSTNAFSSSKDAYDLGGVPQDVSEIRDILRQYPDKTDTVISLLGDINKQLQAGIPTSSISLEDMEERVKKSKLNPLNWTIGDSIGAGIRGAKNVARTILRTGRNVSRMLGNKIGVAGTLAKSAFSKAGDFFNDLWIKGEIKARLTKAKLLAGEYYDEASGNILKSWKDIKGRVVDKDGNVILDIDEMKNAFIGTKYGRALSSLIGSAFSFAKNMTGRVGDLLGGGSKSIAAAKATVKSLWLKYRPAYDVYVKGEPEPILFKSGFDRGLYRDRETGEKLRHPGEIKNEVVDGDGNILVTKDQLARGLVDVNGVTIGGMLARGIGLVTNFATRGLTLAKKIFSRVTGRVGDIMRNVGGYFYDFFGGIFGLRGEFIKNSKTQTETQLAILQILKDRLPRRKRVVGDSDGDGIRDGSVEDLRRRRKEKKAEDDAAKAAASGKAVPGLGLFGGIGDTLKSLYSKTFGKKKDDDVGLDDIADGASIANDVGDLAKKSRLGKILGKGKALGGRALSGIGSLFKGGLGKLGALGTFGSMLGRGGLAALRIGGTVGAGLMAGTGGVLAGGLGALATGALAVLTSPISLTLLGLTAGYYGYKYLTKARMGVMSRARFAQYGFQDNEEENAITLEPITRLEKLLEPAVKISKEGQASLEGSKFKIEDVLEIFSVNPKDLRQYRRMMSWFNDRFKPIFLAHVSAMRAKFPDATLSSLDNQKNKQALITHLDATSMPDGPYDVIDSPFKEIDVLKVRSSGVRSAIELAKAQLEKDLKDVGMRADPLKAGLTAAGLKEAKEAAEAAYHAKGIGRKDYKPNPDAPLAAGATVFGSGSAAYLKTDVRQVSALDTVKYKAYGLRSMEADKIIALKRLEGWLEEKVSWADKKPTLSVDAYDLAEAAAPWFGFPGLNSKQGTVWMRWFEQRFQPVFLNYIGGLFAYTDKKKIAEAANVLLPKDAVTIANALRGTMSTSGFRRTIWEVTDSPWKGYDLNTSPDSTDGNIEALVQTAKAVLNEEHKKVADAVAKKAQADKNSKSPKATGNVLTDGVNKMIHSGYNPNSVNIRADGRGVQAAGDNLDGATVSHNLVGGGGNINKLAASSGDGWHANKDTILGAASMVGVDPRVMTNLIAIESGFSNKAANGNSTAAGLGQFTNDTWAAMLKKHGGKYGLDPTASRTDARANALMTAAFMKDNLAAMQGYLKRPVTAVDLYLSHFLGGPGAKRFLTTLSSDPSTIGAQLLPDFAKANRDIFYVNGNSSQPRTISEIYQLLAKRMQNRAADFGVREMDFIGGAGASPMKPLAAGKDGIKVVLMREASTDDGTFGKLTLPDGTSFETLELPWRENKPMVSCIPDGSYVCQSKTNQKFGDVYELKDVPGRAGILIHAGNAAGDESRGRRSDVRGCILLGKSRSSEGRQKTIAQSREAVREFNDKLAGRSFVLVIRNAINQAGSVDQGKPKADMATPAGQAQSYNNPTIPGTNVPSGVVRNTPVVAQSPTPSPTSNASSNPATPNAGPGLAEMLKRRVTSSVSTQAEASPAVVQQAQVQSDGLSQANVSLINSTLREQLMVQRSIDNVAKQILNQMVMKGSTSAATSTSSTQGASGPKRTSDMPKPAVDMSR